MQAQCVLFLFVCVHAICDSLNYYHFPYHHHIRSQVFVDSKDVQYTNVPEDDVYTVDNPAIAHVRFRL